MYAVILITSVDATKVSFCIAFFQVWNMDRCDDCEKLIF